MDPAIELGAKARQIIHSQPTLGTLEQRCLKAWQQLSTERQPGGMGPPGWIRIGAIWDWCDRNGLDPELTDLFVDVLGRLDADREERLASKGT